MSQTQKISSSYFKGSHIPDNEILINCMHCGLCLPTCPTYALTGLERSSPRGRIRLMKAVAEGELSITPGFVEEMNFCLDCQACETACPAGIKYGSLVEAARTQILEQGYEGLLRTAGKRVLLEWLFKRQWRLRWIARFMRVFEKSIKGPLKRSKIFTVFSKRIDAMLDLSPTISESFSSITMPHTNSPIGEKHHRVAFLTGCIMDIAYADVNQDTIDLLRYHECEVIVPKDQACCGSLQAHYGSMKTAQDMARRNIDIFEEESYEFIILNSAGCGAFMKEYGHVLAADPEYAERARLFSAKVLDVTEFLCMIGLKTPQKNFAVDLYQGKRVTYHDACHLAHTQHITKEPRILLKSFTGYEYVELPESTWCCGSAGIYNILNYDSSLLVLERKLDNIAAVAPDILVTANPGCMLQIQHGLKKRKMAVEIIHTATFLKRCCLGLCFRK